nr:23 kda histone analog [Chlamydia trachomatis, serotype B, Peptide Partial, 14 aa] [Chlamydia trachomatis]
MLGVQKKFSTYTAA